MGGNVGTGVVITGGASGMGQACAAALAEAGRPVAVWDRNGDGALAVADRLQITALGCEVDVTDPGALSAAVAQTRDTLPSIGGFVHCAGVASRQPVGFINWPNGKWSMRLTFLHTSG